MNESDIVFGVIGIFVGLLLVSIVTEISGYEYYHEDVVDELNNSITTLGNAICDEEYNLILDYYDPDLERLYCKERVKKNVYDGIGVLYKR